MEPATPGPAGARFRLTQHARQRLLERDIEPAQVELALCRPFIARSTAQPGVQELNVPITHAGRARWLRVIAALDAKLVLVVTAFWLGPGMAPKEAA